MAAVDDGSSPPVHRTFLLHLLPPVRLPALVLSSIWFIPAVVVPTGALASPPPQILVVLWTGATTPSRPPPPPVGTLSHRPTDSCVFSASTTRFHSCASCPFLSDFSCGLDNRPPPLSKPHHPILLLIRTGVVGQRAVGVYSSRCEVWCSSSVPCLFPGARRELAMYVDGGMSSWIPRFLLPVRLEHHHTAGVDKKRGHCERTAGVGRKSHAVCWE